MKGDGKEMTKHIARSENRWTQMDVNIQQQIDVLMSRMRTRDKTKVADEAGIKRTRFYDCYNSPGKFRLVDIRRLTILFERYGLKLDTTFGEAAS